MVYRDDSYPAGGPTRLPYDPMDGDAETPTVEIREAVRAAVADHPSHADSPSRILSDLRFAGVDATHAQVLGALKGL